MTEQRVYLQDTDDGARGNWGVAVCLLDLGNGTSRLVFDDVAIDPSGVPRTWRHRSFYTWKSYRNAPLDQMSLTDNDYRQIGEAVVARLLALTGRVA
jgi:hypothetical protein